MYEAFERQRLDIDESQLIDVRYEDLVADTPGVIRSIYESLNLGDFDSQMAEPLADYLDTQKDYKVNQHELPNELTELIESRCIPHPKSTDIRNGPDACLHTPKLLRIYTKFSARQWSNTILIGPSLLTAQITDWPCL